MIVVETRFYPIVLTSYRGQVRSEADHRASLTQLEALGRKAQREGTRHVSIALGGAGMAATERQMVAKLMESFPKDLLDLFLGSYVIIDSALVRGMFTALKWLSPKLSRVEPMASVESAVAAAAAALAAHGTPADDATLQGVRFWLKMEKKRSGAAVES
jgi:hypothetical protein